MVQMSKREIFLNVGLLLPATYLVFFVYTELLGFHAALPYPKSWESELSQIGGLSPIKYWGFVIFTLLIPYSIFLVVVSILSVHYKLLPSVFFGMLISTVLFIAPISTLWGNMYVLGVYMVGTLSFVPAGYTWLKTITSHSKATPKSGSL